MNRAVPPLVPTMNRNTALLLQASVECIGFVSLAIMLWEPHIEGRNAHASTYEIYFKDPFLAYVYLGSIPYYLALYRTFRLFGELRRNGGASQATLDALLGIKNCAYVLIGFVLGGTVIILVFGDREDRPPGIAMSLLALVASSAIAFAASVSARKLKGVLSEATGDRI